MKTLRIVLLIVCFVAPQILKAQNPIFKKNGIKVVTLSNGKYNEFHDQDTIVEIGSALFNVKTGKIVGIKSNLLESLETKVSPETISRWMCIDPMAEEYYSWSPYNYTTGNPIRFIDVMGMYVDDYGVDENGNVELIEETDDDYDVVYVAQTDENGNTVRDENGRMVRADNNEDGKVTESDGQKVNDQSILPQLANRENTFTFQPLITEYTANVANTSNRNDAFNLFKFMAENTNVEWNYQRYTDGTLSITTGIANSAVAGGIRHSSNKNKTVAADVHSHPGTTRDALRGSGNDYHVAKYYHGKNKNAKVLLYMPDHPNPRTRWLDLINNKWVYY